MFALTKILFIDRDLFQNNNFVRVNLPIDS